MKEFSVQEFIEKINIIKEHTYDTCEQEVTKMAMDLYLKYPCYKDWIPFLHGNSIGNYMRNPKQKHREGYRGNGKYIGAYLLKENKGDKVLTADILTSKSVPIKLCKRRLTKEQLDECECYFNVFEIVYYWCGNMIPVICSFSPGRGDSSALDNWKVKLNLIYELTKKLSISENEDKHYKTFLNGEGKCHKQNQLWPGWIYYQWNNDLDDFISKNYLQDYIQNGFTKTILADIDDLDFMNIINNTSSDLNLIKIWFIINTKLIVQRSYRILFEVQENFNQEQTEFIKDVFRYIFCKAKIPEEQRDFELI